MAESTEGIVLRRIDYSETSLIVHFYTPDFGQLGALAKGAKRPKSNFQGGVDLLTRNQIVFLRRGPGGLATLTESAILDDYRGLRSDLNRLFRAEYVVELVSAMTTEEDPNPGLYDLLTHTLSALAEGRGNRVTQTIAFELGLMALAGYGVDWRHCAACGRAVGERGFAWFSPSAGGLLCRVCAGNGEESAPPGAERGGPHVGVRTLRGGGAAGALDPGVLAAAALLAEAAARPNAGFAPPAGAAGRRAERLRLAPAQVRPLGLILGRYLTNLAGRPLRMLKYLEDEVRQPVGGDA